MEGKEITQVEAGAGLITIGIGHRRGQGDSAVGHADRIVRIAAIRMLQGAQLIESDIAGAVDADGKGHDGVVATDPAFDHTTVHTEHDIQTGSHIDQAARIAGSTQGIAHRTGPIGTEGGAEGAAEIGGGIGTEIGFVDDQRRQGTARQLDARAVIVESQEVTQVETGAGLIAIGIGHRRGQGDSAAGHADRIVRIAAVRVLQCTQLVESDVAAAIDANGKGHDGRVATDPAFDHPAVHTEHDIQTGSHIHQAAWIAGSAQGIAHRTGTIGTEGGAEGAAEISGGVSRQISFIHHQAGQLGIG
ncbi:hypothetical protein D3C84_434360 [compost metagenome]